MLTMQGITTEQYRQAAKELFLAMKDPSTTREQGENGFKCLGLMYFAIDTSKEFDNPTIADIKQHENAMVLQLASKERLRWCSENNYPLIPPTDVLLPEVSS